MDRREFLGTAAALGAAALLPSLPQAAETIPHGGRFVAGDWAFRCAQEIYRSYDLGSRETFLRGGPASWELAFRGQCIAGAAGIRDMEQASLAERTAHTGLVELARTRRDVGEPWSGGPQLPPTARTPIDDLAYLVFSTWHADPNLTPDDPALRRAVTALAAGKDDPLARRILYYHRVFTRSYRRTMGHLYRQFGRKEFLV